MLPQKGLYMKAVGATIRAPPVTLLRTCFYFNQKFYGKEIPENFNVRK